jgi:hypothetical protein
MTQSDEGLSTAVASHSHLFPGAVLRIESGGSEAETLPQPRAMRIHFSDGSQSSAELVLAEDSTKQEAALIVAAYTTVAGTSMPLKMWRVAGQDTESGVLSLRIGQSFPFE